MRITSQIAYESIKPQLAGLHKIILAGMDKIQRGTFREIAQASGLRGEQVWKRLSELEKKGLIQNTGEIKICKVTSRPCHIWELNYSTNIN